MSTKDTQSLNYNSYKQGKDNKENLKEYVKRNEYFAPIQWLEICQKFNLPLLKQVFRDEYKNRFYKHLYKNVTTCADVEKNTSVPHKYLTECKKYYEDRNLLKVVGFGICPTTKSKNVQFLSTNPDNWNKTDLLPKSNQLKLF